MKVGAGEGREGVTDYGTDPEHAPVFRCWLKTGHVAGASSGAFFQRRVNERRLGAHVAGASSGAFVQRRVYERRVAGCCFSWRTNDVRLICFHDVPTAALNETLHNADAEPLCP